MEPRFVKHEYLSPRPSSSPRPRDSSCGTPRRPWCSWRCEARAAGAPPPSSRGPPTARPRTSSTPPRPRSRPPMPRPLDSPPTSPWISKIPYVNAVSFNDRYLDRLSATWALLGRVWFRDLNTDTQWRNKQKNSGEILNLHDLCDA